jgi:hypothetical protein
MYARSDSTSFSRSPHTRRPGAEPTAADRTQNGLSFFRLPWRRLILYSPGAVSVTVPRSLAAARAMSIERTPIENAASGAKPSPPRSSSATAASMGASKAIAEATLLSIASDASCAAFSFTPVHA